MTQPTSPQPSPSGGASSSSVEPSTKARRWYDHDPVLIEVLDLLRSFKVDVREQAQAFLDKIESAVGKEALEQFYAASQAVPRKGNRWYDEDPVVSRAVELLRVVPPDAQRQAAMKFLEAMKKQGVRPTESSERRD
jgi:hypothetical protein